MVPNIYKANFSTERPRSEQLELYVRYNITPGFAKAVFVSPSTLIRLKLGSLVTD
jgi:hypothetical protein